MLLPYGLGQSTSPAVPPRPAYVGSSATTGRYSPSGQPHSLPHQRPGIHYHELPVLAPHLPARGHRGRLRPVTELLPCSRPTRPGRISLRCSGLVRVRYLFASHPVSRYALAAHTPCALPLGNGWSLMVAKRLPNEREAQIGAGIAAANAAASLRMPTCSPRRRATAMRCRWRSSRWRNRRRPGLSGRSWPPRHKGAFRASPRTICRRSSTAATRPAMRPG